MSHRSQLNHLLNGQTKSTVWIMTPLTICTLIGFSYAFVAALLTKRSSFRKKISANVLKWSGSVKSDIRIFPEVRHKPFPKALKPPNRQSNYSEKTAPPSLQTMLVQTHSSGDHFQGSRCKTDQGKCYTILHFLPIPARKWVTGWTIWMGFRLLHLPIQNHSNQGKLNVRHQSTENNRSMLLCSDQ